MREWCRRRTTSTCKELLGSRRTVEDETVDEDGERLAHAHQRDGRSTAVDDASA